MSTRFAGSRNLDERRRRRLAVEADERAAAAPEDGAEPRRHVRETRTLTHFPLRKLISARRWKLWSAMFLLTLLGAGVVAGGTLAARPEIGLRPDVATLLSPDGPIARTFGGTLLLVAAQMAVVIWWARSRSLHDYEGRYHIWLWAAATLVLWAFCHATGALAVLGETAQWLWPLHLRSGATLYWLAPAATCLLVLLRGINQELGECRSSRLSLWLGAGLLAGSAGLAMFPEFTLPLVARATSDAAFAILAHLLILTALVHHARHVIYVTPEAPPLPVPLWRIALRGMVVVLRAVRPRWRRRTAATETAAAKGRPAAPGEPGSTKRSKTEAASSRSSSRSKRADRSRNGRSATAQQPQDERASTAAQPADNPDDEASADQSAAVEEPTRTAVQSDDRQPARNAVSPAKPAPAEEQELSDTVEGRESDEPTVPPMSLEKPDGAAHLRIDAAPDKNQLKGLSKRERRMLRKQLKDERRGAAREQ